MEITQPHLEITFRNTFRNVFLTCGALEDIGERGSLVSIACATFQDDLRNIDRGEACGCMPREI
jgi:hypothetical protein